MNNYANTLCFIRALNNFTSIKKSFIRQPDHLHAVGSLGKLLMIGCDRNEVGADEFAREVPAVQTGHGGRGDRDRRTLDVDVALDRDLVHVDVRYAAVFGTLLNYVIPDLLLPAFSVLLP